MAHSQRENFSFNHKSRQTHHHKQKQNEKNSNLNEPTHIHDIPEEVMKKIFTQVTVEDIASVSAVCGHWRDLISDDGIVWRAQCSRIISPEVIYSDKLVNLPTFKSKLRAFYHTWNPRDLSRNMYVNPEGFTIHRRPIAQSTDGARGKIGFTKGRHVWEIYWKGPHGTIAIVGVANKQAEMRSSGYVSLLGRDRNSYGWNFVNNTLIHNNILHGQYPLLNGHTNGQKLRVILDCDEKTLSFENNNGDFLGVAFVNLRIGPQDPFFPAISAVYGNTEVSLIYLGEYESQNPPMLFPENIEPVVTSEDDDEDDEEEF